MFAAIAAAWYAREAALHTKRSADVSDDSHRPWITFSALVREVKISNGEHEFVFELTIKNVGNNVAVQIDAECKFFDPYGRGNGPNEWITDHRSSYGSKQTIGFMVVPDEEQPWSAEAKWEPVAILAKNPVMMIVVSVCYRSTYDKNAVIRQTAKGYIVAYPDMTFYSRSAGAYHQIPGQAFELAAANNISVAF